MIAPSPFEGTGDVDLAASRVLVVDDDPANLRLLEVVLHKMGIGTVQATSDPATVEAEWRDGTPDLVLLDWHMPRWNGADMLRMIRRQLTEDDYVPIVILTADSTKQTRDAALTGGADDFLVKPLDIGEVKLRVRNLLRARELHVRVETQRRVLALELSEHEERAAEQERWLRAKAERVKECLAPGGISILYQPVLHLATGQIVGAEALARFDRDPEQPPDRWFADAAEVGLGVELELAAARAALSGLGSLPEPLLLSINVSPKVLVVPGLTELLASAPADRVVLELTEHDPIDDYMPAVQTLSMLRERGLRLAVDDAGAGFASLRHILRLGPEFIKLDTALTRDIDTDPVRKALASALVAFAADVGATIVAEGIETSGELETLRRLGISLGQGYRLARPMVPPLPSSLETLPL